MGSLSLFVSLSLSVSLCLSLSLARSLSLSLALFRSVSYSLLISLFLPNALNALSLPTAAKCPHSVSAALPRMERSRQGPSRAL